MTFSGTLVEETKVAPTPKVGVSVSVPAVHTPGNDGLAVVVVFGDQIVNSLPGHADDDGITRSGGFFDGAVGVADGVDHGIDFVVA
jgi:hypothetical protein